MWFGVLGNVSVGHRVITQSQHLHDLLGAVWSAKFPPRVRLEIWVTGRGWSPGVRGSWWLRTRSRAGRRRDRGKVGTHEHRVDVAAGQVERQQEGQEGVGLGVGAPSGTPRQLDPQAALTIRGRR